MEKKTSRSLEALERIKLNSQIRLLNKRIAQIEKPESWWKRNIVPLAAVLVSLFAVVNPQAKSTDVNVPRPVIEQHQKRDNNPEGEKSFPTDPFAPPPFPEPAGFYHPGRNMKEQQPGEVWIVRTTDSPISSYRISKPSATLDPATLNVLKAAYEVLEKSDDPEATKAKIIETLEQQAAIHSKLVSQQFVNQVVAEIENLRISKSEDSLLK